MVVTLHQPRRGHFVCYMLSLDASNYALEVVPSDLKVFTAILIWSGHCYTETLTPKRQQRPHQNHRYFNPNKAEGPNEIHGRVLKECKTVIAPILTIIFQKSLTSGTIPSDWKHANACPVYKTSMTLKTTDPLL